MTTNLIPDVAILQDEVTGEWYWACACPECEKATSGFTNSDAIRPFGPFKSVRAAERDADTNAAGGNTKAFRRWAEEYGTEYLVEHPDVFLKCLEPRGHA